MIPTKVVKYFLSKTQPNHLQMYLPYKMSLGTLPCNQGKKTIGRPKSSRFISKSKTEITSSEVFALFNWSFA